MVIVFHSECPAFLRTFVRQHHSSVKSFDSRGHLSVYVLFGGLCVIDAEGGADIQGEDIESFTMTGFYTDGYVQVGIGKITLNNGETADVFLYRP